MTVWSDEAAGQFSPDMTAAEAWNGYVRHVRRDYAGISTSAAGALPFAAPWTQPTSTAYGNAIPPTPIPENRNADESFFLSLFVKNGDDLTAVNQGGKHYIYIPPAGIMPEMTARIIPDTLPGEAHYTLRIQYARSGRNDFHTYEGTVPAKDRWNINEAMGNQIRGGKAELTCEYGNVKKSIVFYIRGVNPAKDEAGAFIRSISGLWYAEYVGIHESSSNSSSVMKQFNEGGEFNSGAADIRYTPNTSPDFGFGIFQLTKPEPAAQHLWSWKANCEEGVNRLLSAQNYADRWMRAQRQQMEDEGFSIPVPVKSFGKVRFEEGTSRTIEHAVALKRYNGSSGGNFCVWDNIHKRWKFNETNYLGFNYVERVCKEVP